MVIKMPSENGNTNQYQLDAKQAKALDLLLVGKTVTEAAAETGVSRETVSRWRNKDATFQAAYNAAMKSSWEAGRAKLLEARLKAVERLAELVDSKDERMAFKACMTLVKLDIKQPEGRVDPEAIEREQRLLDSLSF